MFYWYSGRIEFLILWGALAQSINDRGAYEVDVHGMSGSGHHQPRTVIGA